MPSSPIKPFGIQRISKRFTFHTHLESIRKKLPGGSGVSASGPGLAKNYAHFNEGLVVQEGSVGFRRMRNRVDDTHVNLQLDAARNPKRKWIYLGQYHLPQDPTYAKRHVFARNPVTIKPP